MGAIILNAKKLELDVMPYVKSAHAKLNNICPLSQELNNIQISFNNKYLITNIVNELSTIKKETIDFENKLADQLSKINVAERKYSESAQNIYARANKTSALKDNSKLFYTYEEKKTTKLTNFNSQSTKKIVSILKNSKAVQKFKEIGAKIASDVSSLTQKIKNVSFSAKDWIKKFFNDTDLLKNVRAATGASYSSGKNSKTIWDTVTSGFNAAGAEISSGVHTAGVWIGDKVTTAANWVSGKAKSIWNKTKKAAIEAKEKLKKIGASIVNAVISFVKGFVSAMEKFGDFLITMGSTVLSVATGAVDIVRGISTGNWDWKVTKGMWKPVKAVVSEEVTNKIFDSFYNTRAGKWLDNNAYTPFKSDGIACKVFNKVGYVAGILYTYYLMRKLGLKFGTSASFGSITVNAGAFALAGGTTAFGKSVEEEWNKNSMSLKYGDNEAEIAIDYAKYLDIKNLKQGKSITLTQQVTDVYGNIKNLEITITAKNNGEYDVIDSDGNKPTLTLTESNTLKGLGVASAKGAFEGFQDYTIISMLGNVQSFFKMGKSIGNGSFKKGITSLFKNFKVKQALKPIFKNALKETFKDPGFYIDSLTYSSNSVESMIKNRRFNLKDTMKMTGGILTAYGENLLGNLGGEYFKNGINDSIEIINFENAEPDNYSFTEKDLKYERSGIVKSAANRLESDFNRYKYTNTNLIDGLNDSIRENGLYHFSPNVDDILESGYVKASGFMKSYGEKKSFFFNGVPDVGAYVSNLGEIPLRTEAIQIFPSDDIINSSKLKVRNFDDFAVTYSGNLHFDTNEAAKQYFVLRKVDDELVYANVNKAFYDNYPNTAEGKAVAEFISKKENVITIKRDYYSYLSAKSTNAQITNSKVKSNFSPNKSIVNWDDEVARVNSAIKKGYFTSVEVDSIEEIPEDFLSKIEDLDQLYFKVAGEDMDWKKVYAEQNLSKFSDNSTDFTQKVEIENKNGKEHEVKKSVDNIDETISNDSVNKTRFEKNSSILKNEILAKVDPELNDVGKARAAYIELNKRLHYDADYTKGDKNRKLEIYNKILSFDNLESDRVVCKGWSELYRETLIEVGFNPDDIKIVKASDGLSHNWVEVDLHNGQILIADATDVLNHSTDLANSKMGDKLLGFVVTSAENSNLRLSKLPIEDLKNYSDSWRDFDRSNGLIGDKYLSELYDESNSKFKNSALYNKIFGEANFNKSVEKYFNMDLPEGLDGYEAYPYYNKLKYTLLNNHSKNVTVSLLYRDINGTTEPITFTSVAINGEYRAMIYSKTLGKVFLNSPMEVHNFIKLYNMK